MKNEDCLDLPNMVTTKGQFIDNLQDVLNSWRREKPPRWSMLKKLDELIERRKKAGVETLLKGGVLTIYTATIDDGWGMGIDVIHKACDVIGLKYRFLGLLVEPDDVIGICNRDGPDFLGLTVIHESSVDDIFYIASKIPEKTTVLVGGGALGSENHIGGKSRGSNSIVVIPDVVNFFDFFLDDL